MLVALSDDRLRDVVDVSFLEGDERQRVDVMARYASAPELPLPPWAIATIVEAIASGACCGGELDPEKAFCAIVSGPTAIGQARPDELSTDYRWTLEVAGLSTKWLPAMVEHLVAAGLPHDVQLVSIVGERPTDRTSKSARSPEVIAALRAPLSRAGARESPGFSLERRPVARGLSIKVRLRTVVTPAIAHAFELTISAWQGAVLTYPNLAVNARGFMDAQLVFARTRSELFARASLFDHATGITRDALVNAMARFHKTTAPIEVLEIGAP